MNNLCVFTTGHDLDLLRQSTERVGLTLSSYECKWTDYVTVKLVNAIPFLLTRSEDYFMWVDGHDSLVLQPEGEILARYRALGSPVLISAEANCWPDADKEDQYPMAPRPRFLNAGGFIGNKHALMTVLHIVIANSTGGDDQRAWTTAYLRGMIPEVQIDHARRIFSSIADGDDALKSDSCVRHWNGRTNGRSEYWQDLSKLG